MENRPSLSVSKNIYAKMLAKKKEMSFEQSGWDEWLDYILNNTSSQQIPQNKIEKKWDEILYNKHYEEWVQNFALNLSHIWNESSAKELELIKYPNNIQDSSAIVIGRGPSIKKHGHLELIANSDYKGTIVCSDGALKDALNSGVTPEKFPNFFVVTIDPLKEIIDCYADQIVDKYGKKIKGIFSTITHPSAVERARKAGIKIHWLHTLFDYSEGRKSFNQISALMVRAKNHLQGLPAIQTGGNVGTSSWFVSWQILKCKTVVLIGINHGWNDNDPWELITTHGNMHSQIEMDKKSNTFQKLYPKVYNPEFKCYCILDPIFQYYRKALIEFISRSPSWVTTINATEGGSIFGERIKCSTLQNFLSLQN